MLMRTSEKLLFLFATIATTGLATAFETETHGLITYNAYQKSTLFDQSNLSIRHILGLNRLPLNYPFDTYWPPTTERGYFDNFPSFFPI